MENVVIITCKNNNVFCACIEEEAKGNEWYAQVGYYAQQGCIVKTVPMDAWEFGKCGCDHCISLKHDVAAFTAEEE